MKACFVTCGTLNSVWQDKLNQIAKNDLIVFGFNGLGLVSYKKELNGETEYFQDIAKLSRQLSSVIVCGCDTDTYGVFKRSAVIADKGRILGVSDMLHAIDETEYTAGGYLRIYETSIGKIGIVLSDDMFFYETIETLALCDADIIICLYKTLYNAMPQIALRANAFVNGVYMALCAERYAAIANIRGEIIASSGSDILKCNFQTEKDYHLVCKRKRGLFSDFKGDCKL